MSDNIHVSILDCGHVIVAKNQLFNTGGNLWSTALFNNLKKEQRITIPVFAYLLCHPKGIVLFDTGWNKGVRKHKNLTLLQQRLCDDPYLPAGQAVDEQLQARGLKASDLDYVIPTHMHIDHVGGLKYVKRAKKIMVNEVEWYAANNPKNALVFDKRCWDGVPVGIYRMEKTGLGPVGLSYDLFRDGTVQLVMTPGHTAGLINILIQNHGKMLDLAADCGFSRQSWIRNIRPTVVDDADAMMKSLAWVNSIYQQENCIDCITCHETDLKEREYTL